MKGSTSHAASPRVVHKTSGRSKGGQQNWDASILRLPANLSCDTWQTYFAFCMDLREDRDWAAKIYRERAELVDADEEVTCFFLESYAEICRYMRAIGYGSKGKAESVEEQVVRGLALGRYCSLRTTVRGRQSTQDIALFIYYDLDARLVGSGLVVVSFDNGAEVAGQFADAWFEKTDAFVRGVLTNSE